MQLSSNEVLSIRGNLDISSGTFTAKDGQLARAKLTQEDLSAVGIPLHDMRVWDDLNALLPGTAATDDLAFIEGTWGTDAATLQSSDGKATTVTQRARFMVSLGNEYVAGETVQIRVRGGMITTISDTTATVDLEVYVNDGDGGVGADLCATAAQDINSLTKSNNDFTITSASLVHGDVLDVRMTVAITDGATGTAVIGEISNIKLLRDIKG